MRKNSFKGQAALEFMMTYGWAILVVLAAIGALSYFGILNPSKFTPDTCLASSGFACPGKPIFTSNSAMFSLVNGLGYPVNVYNDTVNMTLTAPLNNCTGRYICPQGDVTCTSATQTISDGSGITIRLTNCSAFANVQVVKGEIKLSYMNDQSRLSEQVIISVTGKSNK